MLQRVYGTAWSNDKQLEKYLHMLEEAEKRDHRRLGKIMDLFHFQEEAPGAVFWHPKGWSLFQSLIGFHAAAAELRPVISEINTPESDGPIAVGGLRSLGIVRRQHVHD